MRNRSLFFGLLWLYAVGGAASLAYQVVLQRKLTQLIGIDVYSVTLIVFIYMLGILIGAHLGRQADSLSQGAQLKAIAVLQVLLGVLGYLSFHLIKATGSLGASLAMPQFLYYALVGLPILIPTTIMGLLTPLMVSSIARYGAYGVSVGLSYGLNVAGAAIGALGSGLFMVGVLGLHLTLATMALVDICVGLTVYALAAKYFEEPGSPFAWVAGLRPSRNTSTSLSSTQRSGWDLLMVGGFFFIGFAALGYEIFAFRLLGTVFGNSPYLFPILLFCYLAQLCFGTMFGGIASRFIRFSVAFPLILLLLVATSLLTINLHALLPQNRSFLIISDGSTSYHLQYPKLLAAVFITYLTLFPVFFMSMFMPLFVDRAKQLFGHVDFGFAYFWQTLGNVLGIIITGLILFDLLSLPQIGTLMILFALLGALLISRELRAFRGRSDRIVVMIATAVSVVGLLIGYPVNFYDRITYRLSDNDYPSPVKVYHDAQSLSLLYPKYLNYTSEYALMSNGTYYVTGIQAELKENDANVLPKSFAGLAFELNPGIKNALFIGGAHFTEQLFAEHRGVRNTIVDINSHVFAATRDFGVKEAKSQIDESEIYVMDGRRFLGQTTRAFDYIHIGIDRATASGAANVFSGDFLKLVSHHLTEDGLVTFYAYPTVVRAALEVFPDVVVVATPNGMAIAAASMQPIPKGVLDKTRIAVADLVTEERVGARFVFKNLEPGYVLDRATVKAVLANLVASDDDNLATEYSWSNRVELFPGASSQTAATDIRVWPVNALEYARLAALPIGSGIRLLGEGEGSVGSNTAGTPFTLKRGGGVDADSSAEILPDGAILMRQDLGTWFDWPYVGKPVGSQWEVAGNVNTLKDGPISFLMRGKLSGRGLVGLKAFCGDEFVGSNFSYAEEIEIPLTTKEGVDCSQISLHVSLDALPGIGRRAEFTLLDIVGN